jgi:hypothetical protein
VRVAGDLGRCDIHQTQVGQYALHDGHPTIVTFPAERFSMS